MITHWLSSSSVMALKAASATANTCGGTSKRLWRMYLLASLASYNLSHVKGLAATKTLPMYV